MLGNRRSDTAPEVRLRSELHARGLRFFKDRYIRLAEVRTRPDIVFPVPRVAVYLDGCFWHCCPEHGVAPRTNASYWVPKLERNVRRDQRATAALTDAGWVVLRIWEHEPVDIAADKVVEAVTLARRASAVRH